MYNLWKPSTVQYVPKYPNKSTYLVQYTKPDPYNTSEYLEKGFYYLAQQCQVKGRCNCYNVFTAELKNRNMIKKRFKRILTIPATITNIVGYLKTQELTKKDVFNHKFVK